MKILCNVEDLSGDQWGFTGGSGVCHVIVFYKNCSQGNGQNKLDGMEGEQLGYSCNHPLGEKG